ncbi:oxygenase MpaB family protein [Agitococcus lubricus]|uniref:Uncharacterized protein DUF2236 n=1 Tax=Agitococcus lubricus TaxID=1077255 RepID=A0A2T5J2F8_9GAMM|nr:oxygenase MpaB family protein [Agitococcus lubricus]PTQ90699.1 uncharacterized protein DUF2236 [Agitococcus lubricus]
MMSIPTRADILAFEKIGDPLADKVVDYLYQHKLRASNIWQLVQQQAAIGNPECQALYHEVCDVPDWVNWAAIEQGAQVFLRAAPVALVAFALGALPLTYAVPNIARVLASTKRLEQDAIRRLYETGSMVGDVLAKDGLRVNQVGFNSVLRVRLLHTFVRRHVAIKDAEQGLQLPLAINQAEMAWVACGFSHVVLVGLERLGVYISDDDRRAYHHLWRYSNHLMGVPNALLSDSPEHDARLYAQLKTVLCAPDDCGRLLTDTLANSFASQPPFFLPRRELGVLGSIVIPDQDLVEGLGFKLYPERHLLPVVKTMVYAASRSTRLAKTTSAELGRQYIRYVLQSGLKGRMADFQMQGAH